jgi:hypothetical protein
MTPWRRCRACYERLDQKGSVLESEIGFFEQDENGSSCVYLGGFHSLHYSNECFYANRHVQLRSPVLTRIRLVAIAEKELMI